MPSHLAIPGVTHIPEVAHVDHAQRRSLRLAVAICSLGGVFQMELTGTSYPGCPALPEYLDQKGNPLVSMGAQEYLNFITLARQHFMLGREFRGRRREAMLVHDRNTVHMSKLVKNGLEKLHLPAVAMPPRSPDLMPLDYGIFGICKLKLERTTPRNKPWETRVSNFKSLIQEASVKPTIDQFKDRLNAVLRSGGGHIDQSLKAVRNE